MTKLFARSLWRNSKIRLAIYWRATKLLTMRTETIISTMPLVTKPAEWEKVSLLMRSVSNIDWTAPWFLLKHTETTFLASFQTGCFLLTGGVFGLVQTTHTIGVNRPEGKIEKMLTHASPKFTSLLTSWLLCLRTEGFVFLFCFFFLKFSSSRTQALSFLPL